MPWNRCKVVGCMSKKTDGITLFGIPQQRKEAREKWFQFLLRSGWRQAFNPNTSYKICELHFDESLIVTSSHRKHLKPDAIPTILNVSFNYLFSSLS